MLGHQATGRVLRALRLPCEAAHENEPRLAVPS